MNLALRKATKAEIIDAEQHDSIIGQLPQGDTDVPRLDPESMYYLSAWIGFGRPVAEGLMGVMDLRAFQAPGRELWLEREVIAYGQDPEPFRVIWRMLDDWLLGRAHKSATAKKGNDG